jgi:beta-galactosidase GanA
MTGASIVGVGMTGFGVHDVPLTELFAEAAFPALDDAGVDAGDVEAFYLGNAMGGMTENDTHLAPKTRVRHRRTPSSTRSGRSWRASTTSSSSAAPSVVRHRPASTPRP